MYDIKFYNMLSDAHDMIVSKSSFLEQSKKELAKLEKNKSKVSGLLGTTVQDDIDELVEQTSEAYLAITYAKSLLADLTDRMIDVRLLASFVDGRFNDDVFNRLYEDRDD